MSKLIEILIQIGITILIVCIICGITFLILGKLSYLWDKEQTICEKKGGVPVFYECQESFLSAFRCNKIKTGSYCEFPNGTSYKLIYE